MFLISRGVVPDGRCPGAVLNERVHDAALAAGIIGVLFIARDLTTMSGMKPCALMAALLHAGALRLENRSCRDHGLHTW